VVEQLLAADYALRRNGDVGYFDDNGLEQLKNIYMRSVLQKADSDPDAFLADEDHASYLYDLNSYSEGGDEGRRWIEVNITSPTRFLQFAKGQVSVRTTHSRGIIQTSYIPASSLADFLGVERWAEWAVRLDSFELNEDQSRTLALVKEALVQSKQGSTAEEMSR
jgi:hypothetical protein